MKWIGERISVVDDKNKTTIIIYPEKRPLITGLMGAWIFMWYGIGITIMWSFFALNLSENEKVMIFVFMTFWLYYAYRVTKSFFWLMWGTENLKIDSIGLTIKNAIGKAGRANVYYIENIKKIRLEIPKDRSIQNAWESSPWINGGERIFFDYMGKIKKMGRKLPEKEVTLLFNLITKRIEEHLKAKVRSEKLSQKEN
ncbi:MAG: hypothetical protein M9916_03820 [Crocinitomicaceae bacterium]|nr:hypothetical protein [Crocinitomicaceae bacterium]